MNTQTIIVPGPKVEGNITSCKIEQVLKSIDKKSVFSLRQTSTYITYDVCNKQIITEYKVPEFTSFSVIFGIAIIFCLMMGMVIISEKNI
jgi:hypothetical protein